MRRKVTKILYMHTICYIFYTFFFLYHTRYASVISNYAVGGFAALVDNTCYFLPDLLPIFIVVGNCQVSSVV